MCVPQHVSSGAQSYSLAPSASSRLPHCDSDNDHSFSHLPVHRALTCLKDQTAGAVAHLWLAKEIRPMPKT